MSTLKPFVYWSQTAETVSFLVDLKDVESLYLKVFPTKVKYRSEGTGAHARSMYEFMLDLYDEVQDDESGEDLKPLLRVFDSRVEIVLNKVKSSWWPRVTAEPQKPAWLKINFDAWKSEDMCDDDEVDQRDVMRDYPGMYDKLHQQEMGYKKEDFKKVYLILYNLFQFVGFMYVMCVMLIRYFKLGQGAVGDIYQHVGTTMKFLQLMQFLEVMHPLFGYTKGGVMVPLMQVSGRAMVLFVMIESEPRMQTKPVVFYLFAVWICIEVVRYPYYITQLYKVDMHIITWLRYTLWIPLYPLGVLCESIIILRNIPYFEETKKFSVALPNEWNFTFNLPNLMRIYLLILTFPGLYTVMLHMHRNRVTKLRSYEKVMKKNV